MDTAQNDRSGQSSQPTTTFNLYDADGTLLARLQGVAQQAVSTMFQQEARELRAGAR